MERGASDKCWFLISCTPKTTPLQRDESVDMNKKIQHNKKVHGLEYKEQWWFVV